MPTIVTVIELYGKLLKLLVSQLYHGSSTKNPKNNYKFKAAFWEVYLSKFHITLHIPILELTTSHLVTSFFIVSKDFAKISLFRLSHLSHSQRYQAYKHHWSGTRLPVVLEVSPTSLEQLDPSTHTLLASYPYADIQGIVPVRDVPGGIVLAVGGYSRLHMFSPATDAQVIISKMLEMANLTLSTSIKVLTVTTTLEEYHNQRFGEYRYGFQYLHLNK